MHFVSKIDPSTAQTPKGYEGGSSGFRRATYVDRAMGSVHMGTGICFLDPNGVIQHHLHSVEESFYILEGSLVLQLGEQEHQLGPGNFGLISTGLPHSWRSAGDHPARWLEAQAPQPRPLEAAGGRDTFFISGGIAKFGSRTAPEGPST